jgi:hypothetical protein
VEAILAEALARLWSDERPLLSERGTVVAADLQRRYDVRLPSEFEAYLREGSPKTDWDSRCGFTLWPPERIKSLPDERGTETPALQRNPEVEREADKYLVFADYLAWCYAYAVCCSDGPNRGKVALIGANPDRFVASSLSSFLVLAADDSIRLHSPAGDHFSDLI